MSVNQDTPIQNVSLADLQKILLKEVHSPVLTSFDPDLYRKIAAVVAHLQGAGYDGFQAKTRDRLIALISLAAESLLDNRVRKIAAAADSIDYSKLTDEEKYIFEAEGEFRKRADAIITACSDGRPKLLESMAAKVRSRRILVRFLRPVEQFIGIDLTKYGPFKEQDVATIPFENARAFIANRAAVEVEATLT